MGSLVKNVIGAVITVAIGGAVFTVSQPAVVDNFAKDTGLTQQEAKQYVEQAGDDLVSWDEVGKGFIDDGNDIISTVNTLDCDNYTYDWVSPSLTCENGKAELYKIGHDETALGEAYKKLSLDSASKADIPAVIALIDTLNYDYSSDFIDNILDSKDVDDMKKSNSYNKATLQAVLDEN